MQIQIQIKIETFNQCRMDRMGCCCIANELWICLWYSP